MTEAIRKPVCLLCGSEKSKHYKQIESFGHPVSYYLCLDCGFVYQNEAETIAKDDSFYEENYRTLYQDTEEPTAKDLRQQTLRAFDQAQFLRGNHLAPSNILDIGASSGLLLETFQHEFGAEVTGVEPGNAYRAMAEERDIQMFSSLSDLLETNYKPFDLVTMMHVLEHLPEPLDTLRKIRKELLASNGALLVEVPNFYAHESFELAHLSCFSPHSLKEMLHQAGFEIQAFRKHGYPRSKTLKLYIEALARPIVGEAEPGKVKPEACVPLKRSLSVYWRKMMSRLRPKDTWLEV